MAHGKTPTPPREAPAARLQLELKAYAGVRGGRTLQVYASYTRSVRKCTQVYVLGAHFKITSSHGLGWPLSLHQMLCLGGGVVRVEI